MIVDVFAVGIVVDVKMESTTTLLVCRDMT